MNDRFQKVVSGLLKYGSILVLESLFLAVSLVQQVRPKQSLRAHDIDDVHGGLLDPVEYAARWNDKFSVGGTRKLRWSFPGLRVGLKSFDPVEYLLNVAGCS